ncbi:pectinesterase inhibitor 3-like [Impatiens glandulifera]|uniref:pectinesterase inhibitor 3-like n=1 Tax=Impatiens glandulifera TaxID=253017 RepID=UPI001FB0DEDD|nr:pectinesterase inhibitor 3-like [Impatiens glandulifera]
MAKIIAVALMILVASLQTITTTTLAKKTKTDLVRSSCLHATYPQICIRSLSSYSASVSAITPRGLAQASVRVSLRRARRARSYLATVIRTGSKREQGALRDCVEQLGDSVDELSRTLFELNHLRSGTFRWQMSNAETWVSAALTNEDTCLDGFREIERRVRWDVNRRMRNVARVTSNALYLINRLDQINRRRLHLHRRH